MDIESVRLCNFRNSELSEASFGAPSVWIYGSNAQGKTNLLESCALLWALRSFRTSKTANLIKNGAQTAKVLAKLNHETLGKCEVLMEFSNSSKKVFVNNEEQKKLGEFIGKFPIMPVCNDDIKLVRGAPLERRRFIDMLISSMDMRYFNALRGYHASLLSRNVLLKDSNPDEISLGAFEAQMAQNAMVLNEIRACFFERIGEIASRKYGILSGGKEKTAIKLKPNFCAEDVEGYRKLLFESRRRDFALGATSSGPHKDDFLIFVSGKNVRDFASEGQQRSVALSLKLAQFEIMKGGGEVMPVLLCDDILGELDEDRRSAFWSCIDFDAQVIATSTTSAPQNSSRQNWRLIRAEKGEYFCV